MNSNFVFQIAVLLVVLAVTPSHATSSMKSSTDAIPTCSDSTKPNPNFSCVGSFWTFNGTFTLLAEEKLNVHDQIVINGNLIFSNKSILNIYPGGSINVTGNVTINGGEFVYNMESWDNVNAVEKKNSPPIVLANTITGNFTESYGSWNETRRHYMDIRGCSISWEIIPSINRTITPVKYTFQLIADIWSFKYGGPYEGPLNEQSVDNFCPPWYVGALIDLSFLIPIIVVPGIVIIGIIVACIIIARRKANAARDVYNEL